MWHRPKRTKSLSVFYGDTGLVIERYKVKRSKTSVTTTSSGSSRPTDADTVAGLSLADVVGSSARPTEVENVQGQPGCSRYATDKRSRLEDWAQIRDVLVSTFFSEEIPSNKCHSCQSESDDYYRCLDCCQWDRVCYECLNKTHPSAHLHKFEIWKGSAFVGVDFPTPVWKTSHSHQCSTSYCKSLTVVDEKGRQHNRSLEFCGCEQEALTLIRYHLWPSSIKYPQLAFQFEFLKWLNGLFVEGHMSVKAFCESLKARATKHDRKYVTLKVNDIYKALMAETWEEFRMFIYSVEHPLSEDGTTCPACYSSSKKIYSLDADFQLVRKSSAGNEWGKPKHSGHFFFDQKEVDVFMEEYTSDKSKPTQDCSDFQAGNNLRSKSKFGKLDETALFGSTCRHGHPKYFFSLKHGERLGYSVYMINKLLEDKAVNDNSGEKLYIMYDIACSLKSHLVKQKQNSILDQIKLAIPIFHAYGHKVSCQVLYGPRKMDGMGLTDGESVERLWAYLGTFSNITKESTPENRIDTLTNALMHYSLKLKDKLGVVLPEKVIKAEEIEVKSIAALKELLEPYPNVNDNVIYEWMKEEKQGSIRTQPAIFTPEEEYVQCLDYIDKNVEHAENSQKHKSMMKTIIKFEKDHKIKLATGSEIYLVILKSATDKERKERIDNLYSLSSERAFLLNLMKKYARGQAVANRLSKQLKSLNKKMKDSIQRFNEFIKDDSKHISFDIIKDTTSLFWNDSVTNSSKLLSPPLTIRQQAINLKNMIERSKEEQKMVKEEMHSTIEYYMFQHGQHYDICQSLEHSPGKKSIITKEGLYIELKIKDLAERFQKYIGDIESPTLFKTHLQITVSDNNMFDVLDSECEEFSDNEELI